MIEFALHSFGPEMVAHLSTRNQAKHIARNHHGYDLAHDARMYALPMAAVQKRNETNLKFIFCCLQAERVWTQAES